MTIDDLITYPTPVLRAVCALLFLAGMGLSSLVADITQLIF